MTTPESPAPQSAGLSEREKWERCARVLEVGFGGLYSAHDALLDYFEKQQEGDTDLRDRILALADEKEATAARLNTALADQRRALCAETDAVSAELKRVRAVAAGWYSERESLRATLAERERELGEANDALAILREGLSQESSRVEDLKEKLAAAERVVEAAQALSDSLPFVRAAGMEDPGRQPCFITTEGARTLRGALAAYDALPK